MTIDHTTSIYIYKILMDYSTNVNDQHIFLSVTEIINLEIETTYYSLFGDIIAEIYFYAFDQNYIPRCLK